MLLCVACVSASTPNYNVTFLTDKNLINGENDVGEILFIEKPYTPQYFNLTTTDFFNAQRFDVLRWKGTNTAVITAPNNEQMILTTGSTYTFSQIGQHKLHFLTNESIFSYISIGFETPINIEIEEYDIPSGFDVTFSDTSFVLDNEKAIDLTINVDTNVAPKNYILKYQINNKDYNETYKVIAHNSWNIYNNTLPKQVDAKNGESRLLGYMLLSNSGNVDVNIKIQKTGTDSYLLGIPQTQTLFKQSTLRINYQLQVPSSQDPKDYPITIDVVGGNITKKFTLNISVVDSISPTIDQINFSTDKIFRENDISVIATDNNAVKNVTLTYDGKVIVLKKDQQKFTTSVNFTRLSRYDMMFCAFDNENNKGCTSVNKTFTKSKLINDFEKVIVMKSKKVGTYSEINLFNITEKIQGGMILQLVSFQPKNFDKISNKSYSVRVSDKDGAIKQFSEFNKEIKLTETGQVYLQVMSNEVADFDGILRLHLPDYAEEVPDITFRVAFKDFDIPEDFEVDWFDNVISCEVVDTGDLDTSHYECDGLTFPINVDKDDIAIPTTIHERQQLDSLLDDKDTQIGKLTARFIVFVSLGVGLSLISGLLLWFFITQYPYIVWFGKSNGEES